MESLSKGGGIGEQNFEVMKQIIQRSGFVTQHFKGTTLSFVDCASLSIQPVRRQSLTSPAPNTISWEEYITAEPGK